LQLGWFTWFWNVVTPSQLLQTRSLDGVGADDWYDPGQQMLTGLHVSDVWTVSA